MTKIDLHIHSTMSDGHATPFELVDIAAEVGVEVMSITDHDTIAAYTEDLISYAKQKGILLISGVEMSTRNELGGFHVLGYNFDLNNNKLKAELKKLKDNRHEYLAEVCPKLAELGFVMDLEKLDKIETATKANVAEDVLGNPANKEALVKWFGKIPTLGEFVSAILLKGGPAYIKKSSTTPKQAADIIRQAGGKVVLAHPIAYVYDKGKTDAEIESVIDEINPDGLETHYIHNDNQGVKRNETEKWGNLAKRKGLFETIGSDFHRADGSRVLLGFVGEDMEISDAEIEKLIANLLNDGKNKLEENMQIKN